MPCSDGVLEAACGDVQDLVLPPGLSVSGCRSVGSFYVPNQYWRAPHAVDSRCDLVCGSTQAVVGSATCQNNQWTVDVGDGCVVEAADASGLLNAASRTEGTTGLRVILDGVSPGRSYDLHLLQVCAANLLLPDIPARSRRVAPLCTLTEFWSCRACLQQRMTAIVRGRARTECLPAFQT